MEKLSAWMYQQKLDDGTLTQAEADDQDRPGPFSFIEYLGYLLKPFSWGDHACILTVFMMFQVKVSVIRVESLKQQQFHHNSSLKNTDIVLVFCGGNHYILTGESQEQLRLVHYGVDIATWWS